MPAHIKPRIWWDRNRQWVCADFKGSARWAMGMNPKHAYEQWCEQCKTVNGLGRLRKQVTR